MRSSSVRHVAVVVALTAAGLAPHSVSRAATSDDLWAAFDEASERHARAAEDLAGLELALADLDARLTADEAQVAELEAGVRELAVWAYVRAGVDDDLAGLVDPGTEALASADYADQVIGIGLELVGELRSARTDLAAERTARSDRADELERLLDELDRQRGDLQAAARAARAAEDEAARLAAEAAAAAAAQRAAAEAAAATSSTTPSAGGGTAATTTASIGAPPPDTPTSTAPAETSRPATTAPAPATPSPTGGVHVVDGPPTEAQLLVLRRCESGDNYANKRNPRYRGAYQFAWRTWDAVAARQGWHDLVGVDPADAHPTSQDSMVRVLYASSGWKPWPVCGQRASAA